MTQEVSYRCTIQRYFKYTIIHHTTILHNNIIYFKKQKISYRLNFIYIYIPNTRVLEILKLFEILTLISVSGNINMTI